MVLPAFTRLGHECQDLLNLCNGMHVCTDYTLVYTLIWKRFLRNGVRTHVNSKGKIPSTGKNLPRGGSNPQCCITQGSEPNTLPTAFPAPTCNFKSGHKHSSSLPMTFSCICGRIRNKHKMQDSRQNSHEILLPTRLVVFWCNYTAI